METLVRWISINGTMWLVVASFLQVGITPGDSNLLHHNGVDQEIGRTIMEEGYLLTSLLLNILLINRHQQVNQGQVGFSKNTT